MSVEERSLPTDVRRKINKIADEFEEKWNINARENFDEFLLMIDEPYREDLLADLIEVDVELRVQAKDEIYLSDYKSFESINPDRLNRMILDAKSQEDQTVHNESDSRSRWAKSTEFTDRIRGYKLLNQIGVGGMGTVWAAEQLEPVKRQVAIKLIRKDLGSAEALARFEAERQALAMMDHPNIATVFDAGATENGNPYIVMELVKGEAINKYCDNNKLPVHDRLRLFSDVCKAVQHAHQKGIIHRDLKPNNILVSFQDGRAVPKVIDFGLAKALESATRLTDKSIVTQIGNVVGTLKYMSPEQAGAEKFCDDTRSDIYSLGVVLYELLTGSTPLDKNTIANNAYLQLLDIIRKTEPPRPSIRLSADEDTFTDVSNLRKITPVKLRQILQGELDWVVMKALETDRTRRYGTAQSFGEDIERYLNNEPVIARPHSFVYRVKKFTQKNKVLVFSSLAVFSALLLGLAGTLYGFSNAIQEKKRAEALNVELQQSFEREKKDRDTLLTFGFDLIGMAEGEISQVPGAEEVRSKLTVTIRDTFDTLHERHSNDLEMKLGLATLYTISADLSRFGSQFEAAEVGYRKAIQLSEDGLNAALGDKQTRNKFLHRLATIYREYATMSELRQNQDENIKQLGKAQQYLDQIEDEKQGSDIRLESANIGIGLARYYAQMQQHETALEKISDAVRKYEEIAGGEIRGRTIGYPWLIARNIKSEILRNLKRIDAAEDCVEETLEMADQFAGNFENYRTKKLHAQTLNEKCNVLLLRNENHKLIVETADKGIAVCNQAIGRAKKSPEKSAEFRELLSFLMFSKAKGLANLDIGKATREIEDAIKTYQDSFAGDRYRQPDAIVLSDMYAAATLIFGRAGDTVSKNKYEDLSVSVLRAGIKKNPDNPVLKNRLKLIEPLD